MSTTPTVFLVDNEQAVLNALSRLLIEEGFAPRTFRSPEAFLCAHDPATPGCLVLDIEMPYLNGLALQRALQASAWERFIVFITGHGDIATSVEAMKAGAVDFLTKPIEDRDFLAAVRNAIAKDQVARETREELQSIRQRLASLTPREREVLQHVVAGQMNKQIAADLGTAEKTIKVHRARIKKKMGVGSVAELVRLTLQIPLGTSLASGLPRTGSAYASRGRE
ncbi:MAG: response regulator [Pseudomonadota bacterium]